MFKWIVFCILFCFSYHYSMYIYTKKPERVLDQLIAVHGFDHNSLFTIVLEDEEGDFRIEATDERIYINVLDIPYIVGIKYNAQSVEA